jgi:hypothetical protein
MGILSQLRHMREGLNQRPDHLDTARLLPVLVPSSFFSLGNWPGPYARLRAAEIGLTWTVLLPGQTMRYVNFATQEHWDAQQLDWKTLAMRNLNDHTVNRPGLRQMRRANGELSAMAFMFADGLGPSRLLFRGTLREHFPAGYRVAIPEMSCGIAFANDLEGEELATVMGVIEHCHKNGTRPLAPGTYDADDLLPVEEINCRPAA